MAAIGTLIDGKYEVIDLVGEGGMSRVWLARDKRLNKLWAVKEIGRTAKDANNEVVVQSLIAEANLMKRLDHPSLPRIVDIIEETKTLYVVMDYVEGESLNKVLRRVKHGLPESDVISWGIQLCDVLSYLHTCKPPIIYRDMKPGNIMLRDDGTVKLIDFGIAREYKEGSSSDTKILGTRGYAAPEQFSRLTQTDARTDIYSLGVTLYHLVTGIGPSEDVVLRPIREVNPQLSEGLEHIIAKATQTDPDKRYQTCAEMAYDLQNYEKLTTSYRQVQKRKLRVFNALWVAGVVCLALGVACLAGSKAIESGNYDSLMQQGEYAEAIEVDSSQLEPYYDLVRVGSTSESPGTYLADGEFSVSESSEWEGLFKNYGKNGNAISDDDDYARLCYDVGRLYFLYYVSDDDSGTEYRHSGAMEAVDWFERAIDAKDEDASQTLTDSERNIADAYRTIGNFYQIINQGDEGLSEEDYANLWEAFGNTLAALSEADSTSARLHLYKVVYDAIGSYTARFLAAGVSSEDIEATLQQVIEDSAALEAESEDAQSYQDAILAGLTSKQIESGDYEGSDVWKSYESALSTYESKLENSADSEEASQ